MWAETQCYWTFRTGDHNGVLDLPLVSIVLGIRNLVIRNPVAFPTGPSLDPFCLTSTRSLWLTLWNMIVSPIIIIQTTLNSLCRCQLLTAAPYFC